MEGLLPIGTVVLLKESTKRVMIIGVVQRAIESGDIFDYAGCVYPEGYMGAEKTFLFNNNQIDKMYAIGYQDEEQFAFKVKAEKILDGYRLRDI
jgi:hypothetical protein